MKSIELNLLVIFFFVVRIFSFQGWHGQEFLVIFCFGLFFCFFCWWLLISKFECCARPFCGDANEEKRVRTGWQEGRRLLNTLDKMVETRSFFLKCFALLLMGSTVFSSAFL